MNLDCVYLDHSPLGLITPSAWEIYLSLSGLHLLLSRNNTLSTILPWCYKNSTPTTSPWFSLPLNTCSIPLRSGTRNVLFSFLEAVFGFFKVQLSLLEKTKLITPHIWLVSLWDHCFPYFHSSDALEFSPSPLNILGGGAPMPRPEETCSCLPFHLPSAWSSEGLHLKGAHVPLSKFEKLTPYSTS